MIDLSPMKGIRVDPARATVRAELTGAEFDAETQAFGLATTSGVGSTTGIAGLTLGGGIGWLGRTYGLSCDNLLSVDIVTGDGQLRTGSADENADLFWAVRGGGGNFGVVTSFDYRLHRVGPTVLAGLLVWPRPMALDVLRAFRAFTEGAPENASAYAGLGTSADGVPIVVGILFHHGPTEEGEPLFQPLRSFGAPIADMVQPMPYTSAQQMLHALNPPGNRVYWKSAILRGIDDDVLEAIIAGAATCPSPLSAALIEFYGGATNRVGVQDTAYTRLVSAERVLLSLSAAALSRVARMSVERSPTRSDGLDHGQAAELCFGNTAELGVIEPGVEGERLFRAVMRNFRPGHSLNRPCRWHPVAPNPAAAPPSYCLGNRCRLSVSSRPGPLGLAQGTVLGRAQHHCPAALTNSRRARRRFARRSM
jgi:hypothetical protein